MAVLDTALRQQGPLLGGVAPLRLALVALLFGCQSLEVSESYGRFIGTPIWILPALVVPALFAIAGFLMPASLERVGPAIFLRRRFARGWPALATAVMVSALVIGPLLTFEPMTGYFGDTGFARYFLNLVAVPVFLLPGVFSANLVAGTVNDILWATPFAVAGILALVAASVREARATPALAALIAAIAASALLVQLLDIEIAGVQRALSGNGLTALLAFLLGALAYRLRNWLPIRRGAIAVAVIIISAAAIAGNRDWQNIAVFNTLIAVPLTYALVALALEPLPYAAAARALQRYLAGFVLFAYPVQQSIIALRFAGDGFLANMAFSLPITAVLAGLTWHLVQRHFGADSHLANGLEVDGALPSINLVGRWAQIRERHQELVPEIALWVAFFAVALAVTALTIFAFFPESGGI